ncbi:MAG: DUF1576 domain-containing protein [Brotaphodocola sp.]
MKEQKLTNSTIINGIALGFSTSFFIASFAAAKYTGQWGHVFENWYQIMTTPCPLVTDYLEIGGLASAFLNAGACGMVCFLFMILLKGDSRPNTMAGYFLVVAHCFYGLNLVNMLPCFIAPFIYLQRKQLNYNDNLHICMFCTSFGPFVSEFLFRYTIGDGFEFGKVQLTAEGIFLTVCFVILLGFIVPAILPGAQAWHKGYNLYNGGLAFGIFGFFVYNFMYKTMGIPAPAKIDHFNPVYETFGRSYSEFANLFFLIVFALCILTGYLLNGKSFRGYGKLLKNTGYRSDFAALYGMPVCLINIGCVGLLFLIYLNIVTNYTEGAGFTGATIGVLLAALTFTATGQHPKNVWPIMIGYQLLYILTSLFCQASGREIGWTISTQGYINGVAFATGLCPIVGRYGVRAGIAAGFMCASMCTATSALHGGLVLYNGGFTAGITALILIPILEHYIPNPREELKEYRFDVEAMIMVVEDNHHLKDFNDTDLYH